MSHPEHTDQQPADDSIDGQLDDGQLDVVAGGVGREGIVSNFGFPSSPK